MRRGTAPGLCAREQTHLIFKTAGRRTMVSYRGVQRATHCFSAGLFVLVLSTALVAADLTAAQNELLRQAQTYLKSVVDSYKPALQSAGPKGKPKGSRLKLSIMRLESAKQSIPKITGLLAKLPADNAEVQTFKAQFDDIRQKVEALELRLTGKSAEENAAANTGVKLDYKQVEQLKHAHYYIREIAGIDAALKEVVAQANATENKSTFDHTVLQQAVASVNKAADRIKKVRTHLDPLPADGRGVKAAHDDLRKTLVSIDASRKTLAPIHEHVMSLINPGNYPKLAQDLDRLRELSAMYANPRVLMEDPERGALLVSDAQAATEERERLVKEYAIFITQKTATGKRLFGLNRHFVEQWYNFAAAAKERKEALPLEIQAELDETTSIAKEAVEEEKPAFFTGGIPHRLEAAERKLVLLTALDPAGGAGFEKKIAAIRVKLREQEDSLREAIIKSNRLPENAYGGADREEVGKLATAAWKKVQPDAEILAIRIPSPAWKHELIWRNQTGSWYKIDRSRLQVQLVVKHDDKLASIQPINLWKDHLKGDSINAFPLHEKGYELRPQNFMLLKRVK